MKCYDQNGNIADRYQRLYVRPLTQECSEVDRSTLVIPSQFGQVQPATPITPAQNETTGNSTESVEGTNITESSSDDITNNGTQLI